jgi:hypothetical protein
MCQDTPVGLEFWYVFKIMHSVCLLIDYLFITTILKRMLQMHEPAKVSCRLKLSPVAVALVSITVAIQNSSRISLPNPFNSEISINPLNINPTTKQYI